MQTTTDTTLDTKLSAIDRALAAAKARKAARAASIDETPATASAPPKEPKKETHPDFAKAQKAEALKLAREAAKVRRDAERNARRAAKESKGPVHMKKVEKAASRLPGLSQAAQILFTDITTNLSAEQVSAVALHLQHFNRSKATERAVSQTLAVGSRVRIVTGDPRYIGREGTVETVRRIRCFVTLPDTQKPVYLFTSDVEVVPPEADAALAEAS